MDTLIIEYADGTTRVKEYDNLDDLLLDAEIAQLLDAKVCYQLSTGEWVWA